MGREVRKRRHDKEVVSVGVLNKGKLEKTFDVLTDEENEFLESFYGSPF